MPEPGRYRVPSKDYGRQYAALIDELLPELRRVLLEEDPILGDSERRFEEEFAQATGVRHAIGVNSGTDALVLSLRALGIGKGDEVVTAANTFIATVTAIVMAGARPVLVDPDPATMNVTAAGVAGALTPRTRAVIAVHLYGLLAPMAAIKSACAARDVLVLEDAAQSHGARDAGGRMAGAHGILGCFSFHPSKNLGAFGDAGAVTTDSDELAALLGRLRNLGKSTKYEVRHAAPNSKLDTLQAAILRMKLRRLDGWNARRRTIAARYRSALAGAGDLVLPADPGGKAHVYHQFVVRSAKRDALRAWLRDRGINAGIHYPIPPHLQPIEPPLGWRPGDFPVAEACAQAVLSLPISHELDDASVDLVCEEIRMFFDEHPRT